MRIRWTVPAADDLESIKNYLQQHYPHFAESTVRTIYQHIRSLKISPNRGRPGHRSGTRELAVRVNYSVTSPDTASGSSAARSARKPSSQSVAMASQSSL